MAAASAVLVAASMGLVGCDRSAPSGGAVTAAPVSAPASAPEQSAPAAAAPVAVVPPTPAPATPPAEPIDELPPIRLEPEILDFGIIPPSVTKEGSVKLINTGTKDLEILTVQPSCKCTTLDDVSGQKIPAGGSFDLRAAMKAAAAPGRKGAELKVLIDGYTRVINIQLKSEVSLPVRVTPPYLNVVKGYPLTGQSVIQSIDGKPFRICAVGGKAPNLVGFDPAKDEPRAEYILQWDFERDFEPGRVPRYWLIETDREDAPLVDLFVRHESTLPTPRLKLVEYRYTFGRIEQGAKPEFEVEVQDLPAGESIITVASANPKVKLELAGTTTEGNITRVKVRVVPNADTLGTQWIPFTIFTNARQQEVNVFGQIVPVGHKGCFAP
jgi:hypothetical protein